MTSIIAGEIKYLCFIAGIETPLKALTISTRSNQISNATLTLPYSPFISKLHKDTKVTVFKINKSLRSEPTLAFDGCIQAVAWRKQNGSATAFLMCQSDGVIWAQRKKYNFFLENVLPTTKEVAKDVADAESLGTTLNHPLFDTANKIFKHPVINGDAGRAVLYFLTHKLVTDNGNNGVRYTGNFTYHECGVFRESSGSPTSSSEKYNQNYFAAYLEKFYQKYKAPSKVVRIPVPEEYKAASSAEFTWNLIAQQAQSSEGEVNFWAWAAILADSMSYDIFCIPDSSYVELTKDEWTSYFGATPTTIYPALAEYITKPKSPLGAIPTCNIIFPDQIVDKGLTYSFPQEKTRVLNVTPKMPMSINESWGAIKDSYLKGPVLFSNTSSLNDFNIPVSEEYRRLAGTRETGSFLKRSKYEEEFGVNAKLAEFPTKLFRYLMGTQKWDRVQKMMNMKFLEEYTVASNFAITVDPSTEVIPGMSAVFLDESGEHFVGYINGVTVAWDQDGSAATNLEVTHAHRYDFDMSDMNDIADPFDLELFKDGASTARALMEKYIGCTLEQGSHKEVTDMYFEEWLTYGKDSLKVRKRGRIRDICTFAQFGEFHKKVSPAFGYTVEAVNSEWDMTTLCDMGEDIVDLFDSTDGAANLKSVAYTYYDKLTNTTIASTPTKPLYDSINSTGTIIPSTYVSGIVDCHNKYLMQIGNLIT